MNDRVSERRRSSTMWSAAIIACVALISLGLAEQGGRGTRLDVVPDAPLPFPRHEVMGVDLRAYSSLEALQWLQAAGPDPFALVAIAVDPDIVRALSTPDQESAAIEAMDQLIDAAAGSPIAVCLWKPADAVDGLAIAQAATDALIERYPDRIAYASGCDDRTDPEWQQSVAAAIEPTGAPVAGASSAMMPLAAGAPLRIVALEDSDELTVPDAVSETRGMQRYALLTVDMANPADAALLDRANAIIEEVAIVGLILAAPEQGQDPVAFASSVRSAGLTGGVLPEGFSNVTAPGVSTAGEWNVPAVGTVRYARTSANDAAMSVDFVGTEIHVAGLASPDGGRLLAWIDPDASDTTAPPDAVLDFSAEQAADTALPVLTDLPAARHRLVILAQTDPGESVSISGFVTTGSVMPRWTTRMAAAGLLGLAIAAVAERAYTAVRGIRSRNARPPTRRPSRNPRVFNRSR